MIHISAINLAIAASLFLYTDAFSIHGLVDITAPCLRIQRHSCDLHRSTHRIIQSHQKRRESAFPLRESEDYQDGSNLQNAPRSKRSTARAGGRRPKLNKQTPTQKDSDGNGAVAFLRQWAAPLLLALFILRYLFGGFFPSNQNYVYYSRSVYQSTTYTRDGNVETKRKESFQSNVPGLVEKSRNGESIISIDDELLDLEDDIFGSFGIRNW